MEINIPSIEAQKRFIFEQATKEAIRQLEQNLTAPVIEDLGMDENQYSNQHLLPESRWKPPHQDICTPTLSSLNAILSTRVIRR